MGIPQKSTRTKTRRRLRDLDQIHEDLKSPKHLAAYKNLKPAEDLPGLGQFYCIECAKYFESEHSMITHRKGSTHKRQLKALKEGPYTQKDAEAAIGMKPAANEKITKGDEVEMENSGFVEDAIVT